MDPTSAFDALLFPLLQSVTRDPQGFVDNLQPATIDRLGDEVSRAYQTRCSVPESDISAGEKEINTSMCLMIGNIDHRLSNLSSCNNNSHAGAMLVLLRRVLLTPQNLQALVKMCDPTVRTGLVMCHAVWHLYVLSQVRSSWNIQFEDGTSLALNLVKVLAGKTMAPGAPHGQYCSCRENGWSLLSNAMGTCEDPMDKLLPVVCEIDWQNLLQGQNVPMTDDCTGERVWWDLTVFISAHRWAINGIKHHGNTRENPGTRLLKKLGACNVLFRKILRRVVSGEIWSPSPDESRFEELAPVMNFLMRFLHCLVAVPRADRELDALVRRARMVLMENFMTSMMTEVAVLARDTNKSMVAMNESNDFFAVVDPQQWEIVKMENDEMRWKRLEKKYLLDGDDGSAHQKSIAQQVKKVCKKNLKRNNNLQHGEMCANCFVLEKDLGEDLRKCSRCYQVRYCSRECQKEHWKKAHKIQCKEQK